MIYALILLIFGSLAAEEAIWVELETESPLIPLYMTPMNQEGSALPQEYIRKLEGILAYDLKYNGATRLLSDNKKFNELIKQTPYDSAETADQLKKSDAYYVVRSNIKDKKLNVKLITVNHPDTKAINGIILTGDLAKDRRQIHRVADTIHKTLFNKQGIASTHLLFTHKTWDKNLGKFVSEVYETDWDGENTRPLTVNSGYAVTPTYIPPKPGASAGSFYYVAYPTGQPKIFSSSLKEFKPTRFSSMKGNQLMPAITYAKDKVAFISDITGNPDLFIQPIREDGTLNGKPSQIFSAFKATQGTPTFSPDGKKIAFVSNKDGAARVYMMDVPAAGASIKNLKPNLVSRHTKESTAPAWSPDGKKLAYTSRTEGVRQIWVYDLERNEERQITHGPGNKENPTWAPNSLHLAFNSTIDEIADLYILNLNQPEAVKLKMPDIGKGSRRFPSWEPRPE